MINMITAIITSLATGDKTRTQIANELGLAPPKVAGVLAKLVTDGQVVISDKVRLNGKDVSIYAAAKQQSVKRELPPSGLEPLTDEEAAKLLDSKIYQIWGGYAPLDSPPSKKFIIRRHTENQ